MLNVEEVVKLLKKDGIVVLDNFFKGEALLKMQNEFESLVQRKQTLACNFDEMLDDCPELSKFITLDYFQQILRGYFEKSFYINGSYGSRNYSEDRRKDDDTCLFHHDCQGKQVKFAVLINGVPPDGQAMLYAKGSHKINYKLYSFLNLPGVVKRNSYFFKKEFVEKKYEIFPATGKAGSVIVFDTNGLHAGSAGKEGVPTTRDIWFTAFNHKGRCEFNPNSINKDVLNSLDQETKKVLVH